MKDSQLSSFSKANIMTNARLDKTQNNTNSRNPVDTFSNIDQHRGKTESMSMRGLDMYSFNWSDQ